jgi:hypothetical protein
MGGYTTRAVSEQRLDKHVAAKTITDQSSRFLIMQQFDYNNGRAVFSAWSVPRGYKREKVRA